ncbi:hypothetical protein [Sphingobacterium wenxiniae]|uniref:Uncharacterized protein n=1 Tax=Sphingobacterium wenxiniae TaxID=683125 RepID=A0A1I6TZ06_9SPHI|nr:hypothetical protein [Sphingobacterium wenxiniae]SFS94426.1 hypothetical protein SAMN05660206_107148 [Sphingobacterium wenxiniae]
MQIILQNVQQKHIKLITELAKNLDIQIIGTGEDDNYYLDAMQEGENSPLLAEEEKVSFLKSLQNED